MTRYSLVLHDGEYLITDDVWLAHREHAIDHAHTVTRELMFGHELECRSWCLDLYENGELVQEVLFASLDPTLDHLAPALRMTVEKSCDTLASLKDARLSARATRREARALVARSRGKPYLATEEGEPTIRTSSPPIRQEKGRKGSGA